VAVGSSDGLTVGLGRAITALSAERSAATAVPGSLAVWANVLQHLPATAAIGHERANRALGWVADVCALVPDAGRADLDPSGSLASAVASFVAGRGVDDVVHPRTKIGFGLA
jgi:hypothetical protein